jgi:putative ABC transport system ATP-binding protein
VPVPLFELGHVGLRIDGHDILHDLSFAVPDDGITVLLGPSGSGKTTVLRLLNRLEVPSRGEVRFRGEPLDGIDPLVLRRRVGMVFQRPAVFPGTVRDNLLVARPHGTDDELSGYLRAAGLSPRLMDRLGDNLSGGEAQRLCLARTLATDPEVLLMDEPTSSLDPEHRRRLEATARELADAGTRMVWVTHDLDQADRLATHRLVLVEGRLATEQEMARYLADDADDADDAEGVDGADGRGGADAPGDDAPGDGPADRAGRG